jgi:hypothetical protein
MAATQYKRAWNGGFSRPPVSAEASIPDAASARHSSTLNSYVSSTLNGGTTPA